MLYLYVKRHRVTGLKYFGKTTKANPHSYKGSGKYWLRHLKQHGYDCETEIVGAFENFEEGMKFALEFSKNNNIVESNEWANLIPENDLDGGAPGRKLSEETKQKIGKSHEGKTHTEEAIKKIKAFQEKKWTKELREANKKYGGFTGGNSITIMGVEYRSIRMAMLALGVSRWRIQKWIDNDILDNPFEKEETIPPKTWMRDNSGEKNPMWGKKHNEETIQTFREQRKGLLAGEKNPMFGTTRPDSVKARVAECRRNSRWIYDPKTFQNKSVPIEKLNEWLDAGWVRGRHLG